MPRDRIRAHRRHGITLVEVLVVIVIMGMLAAMLTPALGRARERGRLTACTHNAYQLAFALARYDESNESVPGGLTQVFWPVNTTFEWMSWQRFLLHDLGRGDVGDDPRWQLAPDLRPSDAPWLEQFICPSAKIPSTALAPCSYASNIGWNGFDEHDGVFTLALDFWPTISPRKNSLTDIGEADGVATTLAFAEKSGQGSLVHSWNYTGVTSATETPPNNVPPNTPVSIYPTTGAANDWTQTPAMFGVNQSAPVGTSQLGSLPGSFAPSSPHQSGVVVAYCDGHTGFLNDKIDSWVYAQLLTPKTRWRRNGNTWENTTNSPLMTEWLKKSGSPYLLDKKDLSVK